MLNKLLAFSREYDMITPGDRIVCAVSGGADSVALLFSLYLLREKLGITLCAAHFNHHLRGAESDRDEQFVCDFCTRYDIPLHLGGGQIVPGKKGLEAAARDARYAFLRNLPGKIATAHTADDNAETVLLHLIRGTGLKGLGGIQPISGNVIRPMLSVTRQDVETFLAQWHLPHIEDSSNESDRFLRNRVRHHVMPLLKEENPNFAENMSFMALRLRADEDYIAESVFSPDLGVPALRAMHPAVRSRALERFLKENGVREPESAHIRRLEHLVFSDNPSAKADFPCGITITRRYDALAVLTQVPPLCPTMLSCPATVEFSHFRITCTEADTLLNTADTFTVRPCGTLTVRSRVCGDTIRLSGGTKSLKKLFIDRKIPLCERASLPVIADEGGVIGVFGIGVHLDRAAQSLPAIQIRIEKMN